ncbi:MAG: helix-turn-helix transcriptional regulator [Gordonibacter sp.]
MGTGFSERWGHLRGHLRDVTLADVFDVRALGFALSLAWAYIVLFSTTIHFSMRNDVSHLNSVVGFSSVGVLAVLLLAAFASRPFMGAMRSALVRWAAPVVMAVATLTLVIVDIDVIRQPWCSLASTLAGGGLGVLYLAWGSVFRGVPIARAVVNTASAFTLAALLFALAVALPRPVGVALTVALPLAVGFVLFTVLGVWRESPEIEPRRVSRGAFSVGAVLSLGVLSFAESLMRALFFNASPIISEGSYPWLFLLATIVSVAVVVAPLLASSELDFSLAYRVSALALAFVFLLLPILDLGSFAADLLALVIYCVVTLLIWTALVRITGLYGISALVAFGIGWGAHTAGSLAGTFGGALLGSYLELTPKLLSILALACTCLLFFAYVVLSSKRFLGRLSCSDAGARRRGNGGRRPFCDRCSKLAEQHGLTPREQEIMMLLAKGRSTPRICSKLGLTTGTVNTHLTHLYRKLDVHDKQELIDLLEEAGDA